MDSDEEWEGVDSGPSSVLLGFPGKEVSRGEISVLKNHIGGMPVWPHGSAPSVDLLVCKSCKKSLDLLAQLFCPLPDKDYDRMLYILSCSDPGCRRKPGSVRAIRGVESNAAVRRRIAEELAAEAPTTAPVSANLGDMLFGTSTLTPPVIVATDTEDPSTKRRLRPLKKRDFTYVGGRYSCRALVVEEEYFDKPDTSKEEIKDIKIDESGDTEEPPASAEISDTTDPAFMHFVEVVEYNPEQVLRYERGLRPLFYSSRDSARDELLALKGYVLEVQLMPQLISVLETDEMIADGMEWGSIFVATHSDDPLPTLDSDGVGYSEEWVSVQWEQEVPRS